MGKYYDQVAMTASLMKATIGIDENVAEFQPILVTWHTPAYDSREIKFVCRTQTQLDFLRETLHVKHWEQRIYTIDQEERE